MSQETFLHPQVQENYNWYFKNVSQANNCFPTRDQLIHISSPHNLLAWLREKLETKMVNSETKVNVKLLVSNASRKRTLLSRETSMSSSIIIQSLRLDFRYGAIFTVQTANYTLEDDKTFLIDIETVPWKTLRDDLLPSVCLQVIKFLQNKTFELKKPAKHSFNFAKEVCNALLKGQWNDIERRAPMMFNFLNNLADGRGERVLQDRVFVTHQDLDLYVLHEQNNLKFEEIGHRTFSFASFLDMKNKNRFLELDQMLVLKAIDRSFTIDHIANKKDLFSHPLCARNNSCLCPFEKNSSTFIGLQQNKQTGLTLKHTFESEANWILSLQAKSWKELTFCTAVLCLLSELYIQKIEEMQTLSNTTNNSHFTRSKVPHFMQRFKAIFSSGYSSLVAFSNAAKHSIECIHEAVKFTEETDNLNRAMDKYLLVKQMTCDMTFEQHGLAFTFVEQNAVPRLLSSWNTSPQKLNSEQISCERIKFSEAIECSITDVYKSVLFDNHRTLQVKKFQISNFLEHTITSVKNLFHSKESLIVTLGSTPLEFVKLAKLTSDSNVLRVLQFPALPSVEQADLNEIENIARDYVEQNKTFINELLHLVFFGNEVYNVQVQYHKSFIDMNQIFKDQISSFPSFVNFFNSRLQEEQSKRGGSIQKLHELKIGADSKNELILIEQSDTKTNLYKVYFECFFELERIRTQEKWSSVIRNKATRILFKRIKKS